MEEDRLKAVCYYVDDGGDNLRRPMADYLGNDIYELRPKDNRIFYFFYVKNNVVLIHAIKKKMKKIPPGDLALCIRRKQEIESEYGRHLEKLELGGDLNGKSKT